MDEKYQQRREHIDVFFVESHLVPGQTKIVQSPNGEYELTIDQYTTKESCWNYSRGLVKKVSDGSLIADVKRNYSHFWYCWHKHQNSCAYLICGEDYQGYTVINLTKRQVHTYFPPAAYEGMGFCWVAGIPSPSSSILAIEGCYWAFPYEIVFFDFSNPDVLPYAELARIDAPDVIKGWKDDETFVYEAEQKIRKSDGKLYDDLSEEEQAELNKNPSLMDKLTKTIEYKPRQPK